MTLRRLSFLAGACVLALPAFAPDRAAAHDRDVHLALARSAPAADEMVASPREIRLWFTQAPQKGITTIRLANAAGKSVALGSIGTDPADAKVAMAAVQGMLSPGRYLVTWRTMAVDSHVVGGEFPFTVRAE
jgi:methionine-rich copper-binding protein CopC